MVDPKDNERDRIMNPAQPDDEHAEESLFDDDTDLPEDPLLEESLRGLPEIKVPSTFLPNVMFQVYEKHARERISIPQVLLISAVLLILTIGFFTLDIYDYMAGHDIDGFSQGMSIKVKAVLAQFDEWLSAFGGLVSASWQIVSGSLGYFFKNVSIGIQILILLMILALGFGAKRLLNR